MMWELAGTTFTAPAQAAMHQLCTARLVQVEVPQLAIVAFVLTTTWLLYRLILRLHAHRKAERGRAAALKPRRLLWPDHNWIRPTDGDAIKQVDSSSSDSRRGSGDCTPATPASPATVVVRSQPTTPVRPDHDWIHPTDEGDTAGEVDLSKSGGTSADYTPASPATVMVRSQSATPVRSDHDWIRSFDGDTTGEVDSSTSDSLGGNGVCSPASPPSEATNTSLDAPLVHRMSQDDASLDQMARLIQRKYRGRSKQLQKQIRISLCKLPAEAAQKACAGGLDGIADLVCEALGTNVWQRAVMNAPDVWEEEDMLQACSDILLRPAISTCVWLLAQPTFFERMLLAAYEGQSRKAAAPPTPRTPTPRTPIKRLMAIEEIENSSSERSKLKTGSKSPTSSPTSATWREAYSAALHNHKEQADSHERRKAASPKQLRVSSLPGDMQIPMKGVPTGKTTATVPSWFSKRVMRKMAVWSKIGKSRDGLKSQ